MRSLLLTIPLLTAAVFAQQPGKQPPAPNTDTVLLQRLTVLSQRVDGGCPVGMIAQRRGSGQTIWAIALEDVARPDFNRLNPANTGVHVQLQAIEKSIRQVELAVDYLPPGGRVMPVSQVFAPGDRKKTFSLSVETGASFMLAGDLLVGPSSGIKRVHLINIDYADGTTWHTSRESACSVEPNGFMLVGAK